MKKIVVIGGGTGSYTVLKGLKVYPLQISAIVNMFDSGGSTGKLRDNLGVLPPGDLRRCLIALADDDKENILRDLFSFRFEGGVGNHSLGNLIITASEKNYGSLSAGIKKIGQLLNMRGKVIPVSLENSHLRAELKDGSIINGENNIDAPTNERSPINKISLNPSVIINEEAKIAILEADLVVIGPGDLYTSLIPNLLVDGVVEALQQTNARLIYICNLMTKKGETNGYMVSDFLREIENYAGRRVDQFICNENGIRSTLREIYRQKEQYPVLFNLPEDDRAIISNLVHQPHFIRHDYKKLAREIVRLI